MTVTVRPIPARAWGNGIRPFQAIRPSNNIRPYTLKTWRPPVPEPLPPAPLLGLPSLLAIAAVSLLSQIWGLFNGPPRKLVLGDVVPDVTVVGTYSPTGWNEVRINATVTRSQKVGGSCTSFSSTFTSTKTWLDGITQLYHGLEEAEPAIECGGFHFLRFRRVNGSGGQSLMVGQDYSSGVSSGVTGITSITYTVQGALSSSQPATAELVEGIQIPYATKRLVTPKELLDGSNYPQPLPAYLPAPAAVPSLVEVETLPQLVPTSPGVSAPPSVSPVQARPPAPLRVPTAVPLTTAGELPAPAPAPVPVTDPEAHYPVPGAPPVTGAGTRATPAAMAQELGRMEQKVARLLNPGPGQAGDGTDRLQLLSELAGRLLELLTSLSAGGSYEISSPCVLDPDGNRIVTEVPYSGSLSALGVIGNKVDALAELLQAHKDLKQPICRPAPAAGQPVTVQFEQVE